MNRFKKVKRKVPAVSVAEMAQRIQEVGVEPLPGSGEMVTFELQPETMEEDSAASPPLEGEILGPSLFDKIKIERTPGTSLGIGNEMLPLVAAGGLASTLLGERLIEYAQYAAEREAVGRISVIGSAPFINTDLPIYTHHYSGEDLAAAALLVAANQMRDDLAAIDG